MRAIDMTCSVCNEPIYNPVCPMCLTDSIEGWLEKKKISLVKEFRKQVNAFISSIHRKYYMKCAVCRTETEYSSCPFCFTEHVFKWLSKENKMLAIEFVKNFNFDFQKTSYGKMIA